MLNGNKTKVAVLMGGTSSEREVSIKSGEAVLKALINRGHDAFKIDTRDDFAAILPGFCDVAFIALHGSHGEDGSIQGLLEMMGVPYTGSGVLASAITMDKALAKMVMKAQGIRTPEYKVLRADDMVEGKIGKRDLFFPLIVKPNSEGSTIGVIRVERYEDIEDAVKESLKFGDKVVVEQFIKGREVTVSVLDGITLPVVEVIPKNGFYDYEAKYTKGMTEYIVPAKLEAAMAAEVSEISRKVYDLFECRGAARVDIIIGEEGPTVLEINTVPGMTETSLLPMAAKEGGLDFEDLVESIVDSACLDSGKADSFADKAGHKALRAVGRG